jgi:tight adherence protein B
MSPEMVIMLSGLAFLSVVLFFLGLDRMMSSRTQTIEARLDRYATRTAAQAETIEQASTRPSRWGRLGNLGDNKRLIIDLGRADLKLTPSEFMGLNVISVVGLMALGFILGRGSLLLLAIGGIAGFYLPRLYLNWKIAQRLNAFNNQLSDTLILLANSLRSGYSLLQSMETVSRDIAPPMSTEFARVVREIGLGLSIDEALSHMLDRVKSEDLDLVITAINIQHEVGGNLAELLDTISHTIRERVRIKGQIQAMTATQRLSGNVVALLPIALGLFMYVVNPLYIQRMWQNVCGIIMLTTGLITITAGYFAIRKITDIEV